MLLKVIDKILMKKTIRKVLFKHYFDWMKYVDPLYMSMLDYNTFLGTCDSIKLLKEHKDCVKHYKY